MAKGRSTKAKESNTRAAAPATGAEISQADRERMIAEAAYFRAQARGFQGDPLEDWLAAEAEINRTLPPRSTKQ